MTGETFNRGRQGKKQNQWRTKKSEGKRENN
jgi:hypothetical protein